MYTVLDILLAHPDAYVSGETIAESLNMTRANVWKSIAKYREAGIEIDSKPKRGYRFIDAHHTLVPSLLNPNLSGFKHLYVLESVDSTNNYAKQKAQTKRVPFLVVADQQTAGKGRMGRQFHSPEAKGIYMSAVLYPKLPIEKVQLLTLCAAVAVCEALEVLYDLKPGIKWLNDIYLGKQKVCGILTEGEFEMELNRFKFVVVGIGLNTSQDQGIPKTIESIYTAISHHTNKPINRNNLIQEIMNRFMTYATRLEKDHKDLLESYKARSFILGQDVRIVGEDDTRYRALDINQEGHLIVQHPQTGICRALNSGEISIGDYKL